MNRLLPLPKKIIVAAFILAVCIALPLIAAPKVSDERQKLIDYGLTFQGTRYVYGGSKPESGFDCSGFVSYVANGCGIKLARQTSLMYASIDHIDEEEREPGDLIFFTGTYSAPLPVTHVGIYVGNEQMLHCGNPIQYASINTNYWNRHFYAFGRLP